MESEECGAAGGRSGRRRAPPVQCSVMGGELGYSEAKLHELRALQVI